MSVFKSVLANGTKVTRYGGLAIQVINKTGAASVEGSVVEIDDAVNKAVDLISIGNPDPIGIILDSGVPDGGLVWMTISGPAKVLFVNAATRHHLARVCASGDTGAENGKAISEAVPTSPFASDKHFQEIGHIMETTAAPGLALVSLHFN